MKYTLKLAMDKDLNKIEQWLNEQEGETFLCNFNLTKRMHEENKLLVYIDNETDIPIAYLWLDFGILEVKKDYQNKGVGKRFITDALNYIKNHNITNCLRIECTPETSIPFWKKMGFNFYERRCAYFIITKQLETPNNGEEVEIIVNRYKEERDYNKASIPLFTSKQKAIKVNNEIYLLERIIICKQREIWNGDVFIEILFNGNLIYQDKAKRGNGKTMGIKDTINSFTIDIIKLREEEDEW